MTDRRDDIPTTPALATHDVALATTDRITFRDLDVRDVDRGRKNRYRCNRAQHPGSDPL